MEIQGDPVYLLEIQEELTQHVTSGFPSSMCPSSKQTLRIQVCPKGLTLQSYCGDGIGTINPTLQVGRGLDS